MADETPVDVPCPFCGGASLLVRSSDRDRYWVTCESVNAPGAGEKCKSFGPTTYDEQEALLLWAMAGGNIQKVRELLDERT